MAGTTGPRLLDRDRRVEIWLIPTGGSGIGWLVGAAAGLLVLAMFGAAIGELAQWSAVAAPVVVPMAVWHRRRLARRSSYPGRGHRMLAFLTRWYIALLPLGLWNWYADRQGGMSNLAIIAAPVLGLLAAWVISRAIASRDAWI